MFSVFFFFCRKIFEWFLSVILSGLFQNNVIHRYFFITRLLIFLKLKTFEKLLLTSNGVSIQFIR